MRTLPEDDSDRDDLARLNAAPWMVNLLALNPSYVHWGPHEDYMWKEGEGWNSRIITPTWAEFTMGLNDLNEVVHFYFSINRESKPCEACDQTGYNPATKALLDTWYRHRNPQGECWSDKLTQDEVDLLFAEHRLHGYKASPPADELNAAYRSGMGHDAINCHLMVEARGKRLGVYGKCEACEGHGYTFTAPAATLALTLWVLHPRKGCSRGWEITSVQESDLPAVFAFLDTARKRNAERFAGLDRMLVTA